MGRSRFTIQMTIRDAYTGEAWHRAIDCDEALSISARAVEDIKGGAELGLTSFDQTAEVIRAKEMRRDILIGTAKQLAVQLADTLEDAEGWHDASRIEPAREALKRRS